MGRVEKRAASRRPAQRPSSGVSYVPKNIQEYIKQQEIEYEYSSKQAHREMLMSVVSPLGNYLSQRFVLGLQLWIESQQQPMLTQPKKLYQPTRSFLSVAFYYGSLSFHGCLMLLWQSLCLHSAFFA